MTLHLELDEYIAACGEPFTGRVSRQPDADGISATSRARSVRVSLRLRTEGRGDTDKSTLSSMDFELEPHGGIEASFSLSVPAGGPISYDGRLMRVLYEVEARVDLKLAFDPKVSQPVLVVPEGGFTLYDRPHPLPPTGHF